MEDEEQGQNKYMTQPNIPVIIFIVAQIIFIVLLAISMPKLFQSDEINDEDPSRIPVATIDNFTSSVPEGYSGNARLIEETLFQLILRNSPNKDISKSISTVIREGSVKTVYFDEQNLNFLSAIIDVPDLEQSYWLYNEYSGDKNNQYIDYSKSYRLFCLEESQEILYSNFDCKDDFGIAGRYELISDLIKYFDFNDFSPSYSSEQKTNEIKIYPHDFNIDDAIKESYIQQTKGAIDSIGISPNLFTYHVVNPQDINYLYPPQ